MKGQCLKISKKEKVVVSYSNISECYHVDDYILYWVIHYGLLNENNVLTSAQFLEKNLFIIHKWLEDNCLDQYDTTVRFNDGESYLEINLYEESDLIAFKLRWED